MKDKSALGATTSCTRNLSKYIVPPAKGMSQSGFEIEDLAPHNKLQRAYCAISYLANCIAIECSAKLLI